MMIKISEEKLAQGIDLLEIMEICPNSHNCLWDKRANLFKAKGLSFKNCPKTNCPVIGFRNQFESESPVFYGETLKLSQYNRISKTASRIVIIRNRVTEKRMQRPLMKAANNIYVFAQMVVFTIYPLALVNEEIPFLTLAEIEDLRDKFSDEAVQWTVKQMKKINRWWLDEVETIVEELPVTEKTYPRAVVYLVYLFLRGIEKRQLPNVAAMPKAAKDEFFAEIERGMNKKNKNGS